MIVQGERFIAARFSIGLRSDGGRDLRHAAALRLFGLAFLSREAFSKAERAHGPGWTWTSLAESGSPHSEHTITGSNILPHLRCSCSRGRPRSSTLWVS